MKNKMPRVLLDLWVSLVGGYAGIPQDTRTIFSALADAKTIDLAGLIYQARCIYPLRLPLLQADGINVTFEQLKKETLSRNNYKKIHYGPFKSLLHFVSMHVLDKAAQVYNLNAKSKFNLEQLEPIDTDFIWNEIFSKTLEPNVTETVLSKDFYLSDISFRDMQYAAYFGRKKSLNTDGFDYMIFPDVRAVSVSAHTKKIVRYHDSFGFLCPDFFPTNHSKFHFNSLKACTEDSYFVCNSEHTRDDLVTVFPTVTEKAFVIPPIVKPYLKKQDWQVFKSICHQRFSAQVYKEANIELMKSIFAKENTFDYILSLSTLEPRKNYINLIRAWEKYRHDSGSQIKLVIVANKGWLSEEIESVMLPHVSRGDIIHLSGVPSDEIPYLFSHAKCFAYLSFIEGFGSPPLEGMPCECPVLASDNPTHRWTMGDAALYVDPYDVEDIAEGMRQLLSDPGSDTLRDVLIKKGLKQVERYTMENVQQQWLALFDVLNAKN